MSSIHFVAFSFLLVVARAAVPRIDLDIQRRDLELDGRIIGGQDADRFEFPHQVSLQWASSWLDKYVHFCGGSLIDVQWILTSAQCVLAVPSNGTFIVKAGKNDLAVSENYEQVVRVGATIVHESYKGDVGPYDIALLYIPAYVIPSRAVEPIKLPKTGGKPTGNGTLSGWGFVLPDRLRANDYKLQKVVLPIIDYATCKSELDKTSKLGNLDSTNICTGSSNDQPASACIGDYGGPLIQRNNFGINELIGVSSWSGSPACVAPGAPSVYVDVGQFVEWIESTIEKFTKNHGILQAM